jgi:hypothetical protein
MSQIKFTTIHTIVTDLLNIVRGARLVQSEVITNRYLESLIHQYRAVLIKRDFDKNKQPNPDYIQELKNIAIEAVDIAGEVNDTRPVETGFFVYRTKLQLPKTVDFNFTSGIMYVSSINGVEIQLVPQSRVKLQEFKKYTNSEPLAYLKDGHLYIQSPNALKWITIRGIFEVPTEVMNFINEWTKEYCYGINDAYPIPSNMIPDLKELIIKRELMSLIQVPADNKVDSEMKTAPQSQNVL